MDAKDIFTHTICKCIFVGECPGIVGVSERRTVNRTHQKVKLCWKLENDFLVDYYDIDILCEHQGELLVSQTCTVAVANMVPVVHGKIMSYRCSIFHVQIPKVNLKLDTITTTNQEAIVMLQCGSYCNASVTAVHLNGDAFNVKLKGSIDTIGM